MAISWIYGVMFGTNFRLNLLHVRGQDARNYQILFLAIFLILGVCTRDWDMQPLKVLVLFTACLVTQLAMTVHSSAQQPRGIKSAIITALGLTLLLRSNSYLTLALAGIVAIASKFLFQDNGKHWFNPANCGIVFALTFTDSAWVSPGQWGEDVLYALVFLCLGGLILRKVGRWDTTIAFLIAYGGMEAVRNYVLGWELDVLSHRLLSGSLLLFACFMLTDPRSIPNARQGRIIWAIAIALLTFILRNWFFLSDAPFYALFILSPLTVLCDRLWHAPQFQWWQRKTPSPLLLPY
jgi:Na+-transporting NADH:ubiquinone oxidoreductase subunit NqrB